MAGFPSATTTVCTIAARNYVPRVQVLAASLRRHHPDATLAVFWIDDPEATVATTCDALAPIRLADLPLTDEEFGHMALGYSLTELATAVKPSVLSAALAGTPDTPEPPDVAVYLDPDTEVFAPLGDLWDQCAGRGRVLLTPHALTPYPRDGLDIAERMLLLSGVFNLGFVAVPANPTGRGFLAWWAERLRTEATIDPANGLFTDQRWCDLAPTLFGVDIVRDPGVNVAYWNLHERPISHQRGSWFAGDTPLRLFHYSGFDPSQPHLVSVHQRGRPRAIRSTQPDLARLLDHYAERVGTNPHWPTGYRWADLDGGLRMTPLVRALYRSELLAHEADAPGHHPRPPPAGVPDWVGMLRDWLTEPVPPRSLPRLLDAILAHRPDVDAAYLHGPPQEAATGLAAWLAAFGTTELDLTADMADLLAQALDPWVEASDSDRHRGGHPDGRIDVVGFTSAVSGISSSARQMAAALDIAGIDHRTVAIEHPDPRMRTGQPTDVTLFGPNRHHHPGHTTIACINADLTGAMGPAGRQRLLGTGYRIGLWWWEVDQMPATDLAAFGYVDEVWAGSTFVAGLLSRLTTTPVHHVPLPLRTPAPAPRDAGVFGLDPHGHLFAHVFEHSSTLARKNPLGVLDAYCAAFSPRDGCRLVLKSTGLHPHDADVELLRHRVGLRPDVHLVDQRVDVAQLDALVAASTAYVSLHRSEGLGLCIADACQLAVPVVASAFGGCMDFLDDTTALLVPTTASPVGPGNHPYPPDALWAEPDLDAAVTQLHRVVNEPALATRLATAAQARVAHLYDPQRCADVIRARLDAATSAHHGGDR